MPRIPLNVDDVVVITDAAPWLEAETASLVGAIGVVTDIHLVDGLLRDAGYVAYVDSGPTSNPFHIGVYWPPSSLVRIGALA